VNGPQTLPQLLLHNARTVPSGVAHRHKRRGIWQEFCWVEVYAIVERLAGGLRALGVSRGQTVMLISENRPEVYWVEWAAMALGARTVTLYPDSTADEVAYVARDSNTLCVFAEDQEQVDKTLVALERNPQIAAVFYCDAGGLWDYDAPQLHSLDDVLGRAADCADSMRLEEEIRAGRADDIALLTYTSGTTGDPKGVITTHRSLLDCAERLRRALEISPGSEYLSYIPLSWVPEQWFGVTLGMSLPMTVNFAERPDQVQEAIRELAVDIIVLGPRQWESLAALVFTRMLDAGWLRRTLVDRAMSVGRRAHDRRSAGKPLGLSLGLALQVAERLVLAPLREQLGLKRVKVAVTGGAAISPDVFRLFASIGVSLRNIYACSEFGLISAHTGLRYDPETIGRPLTEATDWGPDLQWRISSRGELQLRGAVGFAGYWQRPEKTAEKLDAGWFCTGDSVAATDDQELVYYDRLEHLSVLRDGSSYPKQFIEVRLRFSPYIKEVMVIGDARHDFVTALVNIDGAVFARWAERRNLAFTTYTDLSQRPEVVEQVATVIRAVNAALPAASRVRRFANLPKELDADEGELTRTRKLRRGFVEERYGQIIDGLYRGDDQVDVAIPVRYQDGRCGELRASVRLASIDGGIAPGSVPSAVTDLELA
jgi:long-chain acyl-CoA synthetase